jgi:alpha-amylase/alpha-mannosidase (GH57 family)
MTTKKIASQKSGKATTMKQPRLTNGRYICVHGHFYQPPRENPWLEVVEVQDSAAPYHDWNERITAECYAPNGASRIVNQQNKIVRIVNNYSRISFNAGPTLLSWLEDNAPRAYRAILQADTLSQRRFGGHGSAIAQVYNHIILPLATERDARTQIRWGIADFVKRFGRRPEGMWLAETAVNRASLDLLAQEGILFTILAPHQCAHIRPINEKNSKDSKWTDTPHSTVDTTRAYRVPLDDGRSIAVFFYNGPVSRGIAFEGLLNQGENFADRLLGSFVTSPENDSTSAAQLVHVATDGESYGHHHKYGEMALSYALELIIHGERATLTNYGEFLEKFPPEWEAEVVEDTSWSCAHGIERWRSDCGCNSGRSGWNQKWRAPLRDALDWMRDAAINLIAPAAQPLLKDLCAARDAYISVILDRSRENLNAFFAEHATHPLTNDERVMALRILEISRLSLLMYTSCAWFFDEISGIETVQVLAYAARLVQLAEHISPHAGTDLEALFLDRLALAPSNIPEIGNGAEAYRLFAKSKRVGLEHVGAHYAISSIFRSYPEEGSLFCFNVHREMHEIFNSGRGRLAVGRATISSRITLAAESVRYAVLHLGDQNLSAAVKRHLPEDTSAFLKFIENVHSATNRGDLTEVIRQIDHNFGNAGAESTSYSLTSLFADEQRRILKIILDSTLSEVETSLRNIYEDHASLLHFLSEQQMPQPPGLALVAGFALNASLRRAIDSDSFNQDELKRLIDEALEDKVKLDTQLLGYVASQRMKRAMVALERGFSDHMPYDKLTALLDSAITLAEAFAQLPFEVNLWQAQNIWNALLHRQRPASENSAPDHLAADDLLQWPEEWASRFRELGSLLLISVDELVVDEEAFTA